MSESTTSLIVGHRRRSRPRSGLRGLWKSPFFDIAALIIAVVTIISLLFLFGHIAVRLGS